MAEFKPDVDARKRDKGVRDIISVAKELYINKRLRKNKYKGSHRKLFEGLYRKIYVLTGGIKEELKDGLGFDDLKFAITTVAPLIKELYDDLLPQNDKALQELVKFIYYDVRGFLRKSGFLGGIAMWIFETFALNSVSKEIAKYLKIAFEAVDSKVDTVTAGLPPIVLNMIARLK